MTVKRSNIWLYTTVEVLIIIVALMYMALNEKRFPSHLLPLPELNASSKFGGEDKPIPSVELSYPYQLPNTNGAPSIRIECKIVSCQSLSAILYGDISDSAKYNSVIEKISAILQQACADKDCSKFSIILAIDPSGSKFNGKPILYEEGLQLHRLAIDIASSIKSKLPQSQFSVQIKYTEKKNRE